MTAYRFYVRARRRRNLKERYAGAHSLLYNKYFVDELYDATFIKGTMKSAFGLWTFDRRVVDGAVNGTGWVTVFASWISSLIDGTSSTAPSISSAGRPRSRASCSAGCRPGWFRTTRC